MNLVVTTVAPQVTNMFKALIESSGLNSFHTVSNQIELMIDETGQHIESIRRVGELVVASNNNSAASNVDRDGLLQGFKAVANAKAGWPGKRLLRQPARWNELPESSLGTLRITKEPWRTSLQILPTCWLTAWAASSMS